MSPVSVSAASIAADAASESYKCLPLGPTVYGMFLSNLRIVALSFPNFSARSVIERSCPFLYGFFKFLGVGENVIFCYQPEYLAGIDPAKIFPFQKDP